MIVHECENISMNSVEFLSIFCFQVSCVEISDVTPTLRASTFKIEDDQLLLCYLCYGSQASGF